MTVTQTTGDPARRSAGGVPVLELERVSKVYPGQPPVRALDQVSLTVTAGELVAVTGPSGSGKSTLLHLMGTLDKPTSGIVRVSGLDTARLTDPRAAGTLDQAPVTVNITTGSSQGPVLAVPVTALVAQSPGGYAVEVAGPGNTRRWVPVRPGMFDDADGLVQVTGNLTPGQHVVVAAS